MDCYSAESEFIESLDFLSPPVKRISSSKHAFGSSYNTDTNDVHLLRGFRNKFGRLVHGPTKILKAVKNSESSTSLVLQKTSEGQILGRQYSIISFPSLQQPEKNNSTLLKSEKKSNTSEKPLIKVTVIPKTDQIQAAKLLRRRRYLPKKVQSTTSNHENSIQTKNVYIIVAGRRREKIYEIKTTGSAKLSTDHDSYSKNEEIPITELSNFKHLIQSLNMDKKKKKEKKAPATADTSEVQQTNGVNWKHYPKCNNCICVNDETEAPKKSRVRIYGQFGISEDDKYVLRYGATVDDKQVMSDVAQLTRDFSPVVAETSYETNEEQSALLQDSCIQAEYNYDLDKEKPPVKEVVSKESQGTQVNFNIQVPAPKGAVSDKKVQCSCCGNRSEHNTLKDCQSPMVIISVYPNPSPEDLTKSLHYPAVNAQSTSPAGMATNTSNQVLKTEKASNKIDTRRNYKSSRMSRSPSPVRKVSRSKLPDDSLKPPVSEKRSPDRQKALRAIKEKIREKDKLKQDASSRKELPLKLNVTGATQVSKNFKNLTVSNATQVSRRNQGLYTASHGTQMPNKNHPLNNMSNGTQVSVKRIQNYTATNATQYSNEPEIFTISNSKQCEDSLDSLQDIAPIKHAINEVLVSQKYPQHKSSPKYLRTQVSHATQVPKIQQFYPHQTDPLTVSCATQVLKNHPNVISPRMDKNQETFIALPVQGFNKKQTSRLISKTKAESGTNTDHARAKKALVDTYTKKLTEQMNLKHYTPARFDNSKVTINIDGDREYYNVLFNRNKITTDLTIRKTLKDMGSQKCIDEPSLGSLLNLPDCALESGAFESEIKSPTRCPSIALYNPPEDGLPLIKHVSRLTIRDSLEICHRREDNKSNNNIKNTQTCIRAQPADIRPDETEFLAPIKHFTGDDCSIIDPIERDKQIRELLGVDKVKANYSKSSQGRCENDVGIPYQCIHQQRCKESQVTEINYEFQDLCSCLKGNTSKVKAINVSIQKNGKKHLRKKTPEEDVGFDDGNVGEKKNENKSAIYQQLILNRNIQVFLQVEKFSKQKPIILSRQQYDKVKKTIQKTLCAKKNSHSKRKALLTKRESSEISIGKVRTKTVKDAAVEPRKRKAKVHNKKDKHHSPLISESGQVLKCDKATQTDHPPCSRDYCKQFAKVERINKICKPVDSSDSEPIKDKSKKDKKKERDVGAGECLINNCSACCVCQDFEAQHETEIETYVLFNAEHTRNILKETEEAGNVAHTRKTMSSVDVRYASIAFMKQIAYSSTDLGALSDSSIGHLKSFHTLFRGHRKCATPNLGTSAYSLYSEDLQNSENKCAKLEPQDSKPKKPFLRRLMSCLVMRSTRNSELKLPIGPPADLPTVNSSVDSYHISTSLGAVEVSSSIYDTSASFYSNHTIFPINSKIKRGFFSSVRGFLTNRKS